MILGDNVDSLHRDWKMIVEESVHVILDDYPLDILIDDMIDEFKKMILEVNIDSLSKDLNFIKNHLKGLII